jgi:hypothetical protein
MLDLQAHVRLEEIERRIVAITLEKKLARAALT